MTEKQKIVIPFTDEAFSYVTDLTKRYNLQEDKKETRRRLMDNKLFNSTIIINSTREFMTDLISDKDFAISLKKDLGVTQEIAQKIVQDIINNLVPMLKKFSEEELSIKRRSLDYGTTKENNDQTTVVGSTEKIPQQKPQTKKNETPQIVRKPVVGKRELKKIIKEPTQIEETEGLKKMPQGKDIYREPIE